MQNAAAARVAAAGGASSAARADALRGVSERVSKPLRLLRRLLRGARALSRTDPHTCSCSCACDLPSAVCRLECLTQVTRPSSRRRSSKTRTRYGAGRPVSAYEAAISDRTVRMCMYMHIACILAPGQNEPTRGMLACSLR